MDRDELLAASEAGQIVVLDVRPGDEYAAGHLPGAVSIPLDELASRLAEIPADVEVVAYCRGRYCVLSHRAVRLLIDHGFDARLAADGMLEWRADGVPITNPPTHDGGSGPNERGRHWDDRYEQVGATARVVVPDPSDDVAEADRQHSALIRRLSVIDVGGGSSPLVDELVARGFDDITVLDVSGTALDVARRGLDDPHGVDLAARRPTVLDPDTAVGSVARPRRVPLPHRTSRPRRLPPPARSRPHRERRVHHRHVRTRWPGPLLGPPREPLRRPNVEPTRSPLPSRPPRSTPRTTRPTPPHPA